METSRYNRRNFLSSIAILSAGTALGSTVKHFPAFDDEEKDLQKKWKYFWQKANGRLNIFRNPQQQDHFYTKGHSYKNGETILFSRENILAQPTWVFWKSDNSKPADVIITLFENNDSLKKIGRLNRFEVDALYKLSGYNHYENLLSAQCNNLKPATGNPPSLLKNKVSFKKNSHTHELSYFIHQQLVLNKKFIYHF